MLYLIKINSLSLLNFKYFFTCISLLLFFNAFGKENVRKKLDLNGDDWTVVSAISGEGEKQGFHTINYPISKSIPATVPGDINWDLMRSKELPDIFVGMNSKNTYPYALKEWWYRKTFFLSKSEWQNKHIKLKFNAVDYAVKIWLNGKFLGNHVGQFTPIEYEVNESLNFDKENVLIVLIEPAPANIIDAFVNGNRWATNAYPIINNTLKFWKSRTMTGWDWGTRLWSMGIWQDVALTGTSNVYLDNLLIYPEIEKPYQKAMVKVKINIKGHDLRDLEVVFSTKRDQDRYYQKHNTLIVKEDATNKSIVNRLIINKPKLWWPNGYGEQNLYLLSISIKDKKTGEILDNINGRFGIRNIKVIENPIKGNQQQESKPGKYLTEINGRKIFLHGGNWLPVDLLYGRPRKKEYEHLIRLASLANYNVLRVWGGGLIERQEFYDLCDEYGILVYQEMPNAFAEPLNTPEILKNMANEQRQILPLLINHPSVFRYGFGNELYLFSSNSIHVRQYKKIIEELDPTRPSFGSDPNPKYQGHGPYSFGFPSGYASYNYGHPQREHGPTDALEVTEYSVSGSSSFETLEKIFSGENYWPISSIDTLNKIIPTFPMELTSLPSRVDSIWRWHNGLASFGKLTWLSPDIYRSLFGERTNIKEEIQASQFVQAEGYRYANQSHRRGLWRRSGSFMWTFNEPWPNAAHGSIVEYYGMPKMALYYTRNSYAPINVSISYNTISLQPNESLNIPVFATNANIHGLDGTLSVKIVDLNGKNYLFNKSKVKVDPLTSMLIDSINFCIPKEANNNVLILRLELIDESGTIISSENYTFGVSLSSENRETHYLAPMLIAPKTNLELKILKSDEVTWGNSRMNLFCATVINNSSIPALFVHFKSKYEVHDVYFKDNYFILMPGEEKKVDIIVTKEFEKTFNQAGISVQAWNSNK